MKQPTKNVLVIIMLMFFIICSIVTQYLIYPKRSSGVTLTEEGLTRILALSMQEQQVILSMLLSNNERLYKGTQDSTAYLYYKKTLEGLRDLDLESQRIITDVYVASKKE